MTAPTDDTANESQTDAAPEASNGAFASADTSAKPDEPPAEVPERVARLRNLDGEIRRRDEELRASKDAERASPAPIGPGKKSVRAGSEDPGGPLGDRIAATMEDARKDLFKLAGRVEALESSVREAQQRSWEALQTQRELVNERLDGLEKRADDAAAEAAKAETQAGQRLEHLAGRVEEIGEVHPPFEKSIADLEQAVSNAVEQRLAGLEKRVNKAAKARTQSGERIEKLERRLDEIGRTQPSLEQRLADLEKAMGGAVDQRLEGLEKWADHAAAGATKAEAQALARFEKLAGRVEAVEKLPKLGEMIETLTTRVDALDRRLSEAEKRFERSQEPPATPTPEAAKFSWG